MLNSVQELDFQQQEQEEWVFLLFRFNFYIDDLLGSKFISVGPETMDAFDAQFTDFVQKLANIKASKTQKGLAK